MVAAATAAYQDHSESPYLMSSWQISAQEHVSGSKIPTALYYGKDGAVPTIKCDSG